MEERKLNIVNIANSSGLPSLNFSLLLRQVVDGENDAFAIRLSTGDIRYVRQTKGDHGYRARVSGGEEQAVLAKCLPPGRWVHFKTPFSNLFTGERVLYYLPASYVSDLQYRFEDSQIADTDEELKSFQSFQKETEGDWLSFLGMEAFDERAALLLSHEERASIEEELNALQYIDKHYDRPVSAFWGSEDWDVGFLASAEIEVLNKDLLKVLKSDYGDIQMHMIEYVLNKGTLFPPYNCLQVLSILKSRFEKRILAPDMTTTHDVLMVAAAFAASRCFDVVQLGDDVFERMFEKVGKSSEYTRPANIEQIILEELESAI